jgi:hypothetical protein
VDDIESENHRDAVAALLDSQPLNAIRLHWVGDEQDGAGISACHSGLHDFGLLGERPILGRKRLDVEVLRHVS